MNREACNPIVSSRGAAVGGHASSSAEAIHATLGLLRHFRAFVASDCREMRDPFEVEQWRDGASRLTKPQAATRLTWLVQMAISRKGGRCLSINDSRAGASLNHRGQPCRKESADYQRGLTQDAIAVNTPRLRVYQFRTSELYRRLPHRLHVGRNEYEDSQVRHGDQGP